MNKVMNLRVAQEARNFLLAERQLVFGSGFSLEVVKSIASQRPNYMLKCAYLVPSGSKNLKQKHYNN